MSINAALWEQVKRHEQGLAPGGPSAPIYVVIILNDPKAHVQIEKRLAAWGAGQMLPAGSPKELRLKVPSCRVPELAYLPGVALAELMEPKEPKAQKRWLPWAAIFCAVLVLAAAGVFAAWKLWPKVLKPPAPLVNPIKPGGQSQPPGSQTQLALRSNQKEPQPAAKKPQPAPAVQSVPQPAPASPALKPAPKEKDRPQKPAQAGKPSKSEEETKLALATKPQSLAEDVGQPGTEAPRPAAPAPGASTAPASSAAPAPDASSAPSAPPAPDTAKAPRMDQGGQESLMPKVEAETPKAETPLRAETAAKQKETQAPPEPKAPSAKVQIAVRKQPVPAKSAAKPRQLAIRKQNPDAQPAAKPDSGSDQKTGPAKAPEAQKPKASILDQILKLLPFPLGQPEPETKRGTSRVFESKPSSRIDVPERPVDKTEIIVSGPVEPKTKSGQKPEPSKGNQLARLRDKSREDSAPAKAGAAKAGKGAAESTSSAPAKAQGQDQGRLQGPGGMSTLVDNLYRSGLKSYQNGDLDQAVKLFERAVRLDPNRLGLRRTLAWALFEQGRLIEAREHFLVILKEHPDDEEAKSALELLLSASQEP